MTEATALAETSTRHSTVYAVAWLASNLGVVLFVSGVLHQHIDPVCSDSPWSALSWIFLVFACGGLVVAATATVTAAQQRRTGAISLWTLALLVSAVQAVLAGLLAHQATIPCVVGVELLHAADVWPFL